jgi:hypothetical protein
MKKKMIPEVYEHGNKSADVATVLGFFLSVLMVIINIGKKWTMPIRDWGMILQ